MLKKLNKFEKKYLLLSSLIKGISMAIIVILFKVAQRPNLIISSVLIVILMFYFNRKIFNQLNYEESKMQIENL